MLDPIGNNKTVYTMQLSDPPTGNAAMAGMAQESATFNKSLTTVKQNVVTLVLQAAEQNKCQADQIVSPLIDHLIERFQLPGPNRLQASTAERNPNKPDDWRWDLWQEKHYRPSWSGKDCYCPLSQEKVNKVILALHDQIRFDKSFTNCQNIPYVLDQFSLGSVRECTNFLELSQLFSQSLKPLTPFIRQCIAAGLFTENFINELYAM
ncbi:hypothetical protein [Endozoicomonas sp. GU-1]|uniref:hypothetical protein n=1 Tax=Endozoicomonas sp. GU-1 TaxID=3009078 RepID=UPI0022B55EEB|nr:hypothetical protein [Endozoicomonas sp. GU-1]WBA80498.1 hypothetical protein O2T12_19485 [Endozoicomonas sp. GU-1]WBA88062.1 hypothetical protein O3276_08685 [Endozoicomonas sp. GU-1]